MKLVIDTSFNGTHIGLLEKGRWVAFRHKKEQALECLMDLVWEVLQETKQGLKDLGGIIYCEGPGSLLGIRSACMAIRTWVALGYINKESIWAYRCLDLLQQAEPTTSWACPSGKKHYFCLRSGSGQMEEVEEKEVENMKVIGKNYEYTLQNKAQWIQGEARLEPDAYLFKEQEFVRWNGERHRGG